MNGSYGKLIGYVANEALYSDIEDLSKVPQSVLDEIAH
jgi:inorganic pyrophosphatase